MLFINTQEILNETKNPTQQELQTPSQFERRKDFLKMPTTHSISPDYPPDNYELTTPHDKNTQFPKTTIHSTVKSRVGSTVVPTNTISKAFFPERQNPVSYNHHIQSQKP